MAWCGVSFCNQKRNKIKRASLWCFFHTTGDGIKISSTWERKVIISSRGACVPRAAFYSFYLYIIPVYFFFKENIQAILNQSISFFTLFAYKQKNYLHTSTKKKTHTHVIIIFVSHHITSPLTRRNNKNNNNNDNRICIYLERFVK